MARLTHEDRLVRAIIKDHGPVLDLKAEPEVFIELLRKFGNDVMEIADPPLPGGVGPVGPSGVDIGPGLEELMREVLKLQRQMAKLSRQIGPG